MFRVLSLQTYLKHIITACCYVSTLLIMEILYICLIHVSVTLQTVSKWPD